MDDRELVLQRFQGLRVTDVCDAMDTVGLPDRGQVSRDIRPLWRDIEGFRHRIYGIAHTVRFLPTDKPLPCLPKEEFRLGMCRHARGRGRSPSR